MDVSPSKLCHYLILCVSVAVSVHSVLFLADGLWCFTLLLQLT